MNLIPRDTTPEAYRFQIQVLRRLGTEGRLRMTFELCRNLRELARTGVRMRHPDYDEEQVNLAVTRLIAGEEAFRKLLPWVNIRP
jgi:hypothetical protein